jgi:hypothetical protein
MGMAAERHGRGAPDTAGRARVCLTESHGWRCFPRGAVTLWFKGHARGRDGEALATEVDAFGAAPESSRLESWLRGLDGHFAMVATGPAWTLAAADRVRSIPLIWGRGKTGAALVGQSGGPLVRELGLGARDTAPLAVSSVALSGFTIGDETLYPAIRQLGPGQYALFPHDGGAPHTARYHQFRPWLPENAAEATLERELLATTEEILSLLGE